MKTNTHELLDEIVADMWPSKEPDELATVEIPEQPGPDEVDSAYAIVTVGTQRFRITVTYEGETK